MDWEESINRLNGDPKLYEKEVSRLRKLTEEKPWEASNFFLLAKVYENFPVEKTPHHEMFDNQIASYTEEFYDRAISIDPKIEYIRQREIYRAKTRFVNRDKKPAEVLPKNEALYYQPSGKVSPIAFFYCLLFGATVIPLLSFVYAFLCLEVPYVVIKWVFTIIYGVLLGVSINYATVILGKSRNGWVCFLSGLVLTSWSYYLHWVFLFIYFDKKFTPFDDFLGTFTEKIIDFYEKSFVLASQPSLVFDSIKTYCDLGFWSFLGIEFKGGTMIFILVVEIIIIFLISIFISFVNYDKPFDELEGNWFKETEYKINKYFINPGELQQKLEKQDYSGILRINHNEANYQNLGYSVFKVSENKHEAYLRVENMRLNMVDNKVNHISEPLFYNLRITPQFLMEIKSESQKFPLQKLIGNTDHDTVKESSKFI